MSKKLLDVIAKRCSLTSQETDLCERKFEVLSVSRNTVLEYQEKVPGYLYFIESGFMRLFYYDENGDEVTTNLSAESDFIAPFLSFINQRKSKENIECITECEILRISRAGLAALISESENFKQFSLIIFEQAIAAMEMRANDLATLNAEQRYKKFLKNHSYILQNVPIQYIASFLGMKPESLSRIRRQVIN